MGRVRADRAILVRVGSALQLRRAEPGGSRFERAGLVAKLARGSVSAFIIHIVGAGLSYSAQLAVARAVGAEGYGVYAYVFVWLTVLAYVSALGFDVSVMRFVPAYLAPRAFDLLRGVIQYARRRAAAVGCGIAFAGVVSVLSWSGDLRRDLANTFLVGFAVVPLLALSWICAAVVRGFGGVVSALAPDRIVRDGVLLVLVLLASRGAGWKIDAPLVMAATLLGSAAALGLVSLAMRRLRPTAVIGIAPIYDAPTWRLTALPLVVISVAEALMNRTGVMLLGWIVDTRDAGIYALAFSIALVVVLPRIAVNALLAPAISDLFVRNDYSALRAIVAKTASWSLLGATCIALPLMVLAEPVLSLFGQDFAAGAPALRILLIGQVMAVATGSQLHLMTMTGRERSAALQLVASVAANVALGAMLVSPLGPTGAAVATTTALIGWNTAMALSIRRHLRLLPGVLAAWPDKTRRIVSNGGDVAKSRAEALYKRTEGSNPFPPSDYDPIL
jgi:O-antigen/teichoic acid export membrane protein